MDDDFPERSALVAVVSPLAGVLWQALPHRLVGASMGGRWTMSVKFPRPVLRLRGQDGQDKTLAS